MLSEMLYSQGVFAKNAFVCCGVVGIISLDESFRKLMGRYFKKNAKEIGIDCQNESKDTRES